MCPWHQPLQKACLGWGRLVYPQLESTFQWWHSNLSRCTTHSSGPTIIKMTQIGQVCSILKYQSGDIHNVKMFLIDDWPVLLNLKVHCTVNQLLFIKTLFCYFSAIICFAVTDFHDQAHLGINNTIRDIG